MFHEFCELPLETLQVRPVVSCGNEFALPEDAVMGVLPLGGKAPAQYVGGLLVMAIDNRLRPLVSLRETLCLDTASSDESGEQVVVVVRIASQLFGLLVEQVGTPERAIVHPTVDAGPPFALLSHVVRLDDGRDVAVLNPNSLAFTVRPAIPAPALRLAA